MPARIKHLVTRRRFLLTGASATLTSRFGEIGSGGVRRLWPRGRSAAARRRPHAGPGWRRDAARGGRRSICLFYSDFVLKLANGNALVAKAQTIKSRLDKIKIVQPKLRAEDTPGVTICDFAMSFARQQKAAQNLVCDQLTLDVMLDVLTPEVAVSCYEFFYRGNEHLDKTVSDVAAVRLRATRRQPDLFAHWRLLYESGRAMGAG